MGYYIKVKIFTPQIRSGVNDKGVDSVPQDAFTIRHIANELKDKITGGKISRIVQPARDELTFIIYTGKGNVKLEACLGAQSSRLSFTDEDKPVPVTAPNFCMLLRKHLQNAEILNVAQPDFERIIYFDLKCVSDFSSSVMRLYFEIMGKYSNAVLCENGIIAGALKTTSIGENTKRVLFGGVKYVPPEPQDKISPDDKDGLKNIMCIPTGDRAKFISDKVKGICYSTALDMVSVYGENISAENIYDYVYGRDIQPCVTLSNGKPDDFKVRSASANKEIYESVLQAQTAYYAYIYKKRTFDQKKSKLENALNSALKKTEKRLAAINDKLAECRGAEDVKLKGELITANIYALKKGMKNFEAQNYYDPDANSVKIELDVTLTPSQNAQKYYKRYAKLKRTQTSVTAQLEEAEEKLNYLNSIKAHICSAENTADLEGTEEELVNLGLFKTAAVRKKKTEEPSYRTFECGGFKIISGRNNIQNERLTRSLAPEDIWLHTQRYHSSHVGIITNGKSVPDAVLYAAAEICAYYSDGRYGNKISVDYTPKKFVKKPPKSNVGFVIYTDFKTILADPDAHTELIYEERK